MAIKNYGPPGSHPPEVISQDENNRLVTDEQITRWDNMPLSVTGVGLYLSLVFTRDDSAPATPTGGTFANPVPTETIWTPGIPIGTDPVYASSRLFTSDGLPPQADNWNVPVVFAENGIQGDTGATGAAGADGLTITGAAGVNGTDGEAGTTGISIMWLGEATSHPLDPMEGNAYRNTTDLKSYVFYDTWYQMTVDGVNGQDGVDGLPIVWHGDAAVPDPAWEIENHVYRDTDNGYVYIYNSSAAWELMVLDGDDGAAGTDGDDGLSVYITYHDDPVSGAAPALPTNVAGDDNGWHTAATAASNWMSQKVDDGTTAVWGSAIKITGDSGIDGDDGVSTFTYYQDAEPSSPLINELWYSNATKELKRYNGASWDLVSVADWKALTDADNTKPADNADVTIDNPFASKLLFNFDNSLEEFTSINATATEHSTLVSLESTVDDPQFSRDIDIEGVQDYIVRARVKGVVAGTWQGTCYYATSGHPYSGSYSKVIAEPPVGVWTILEWDMSDLTAGGTDWVDNDITNIRFDLYNSHPNTVEVDWIAIGRKIVASPYNAIPGADVTADNAAGANLVVNGDFKNGSMVRESDDLAGWINLGTTGATYAEIWEVLAGWETPWGGVGERVYLGQPSDVANYVMIQADEVISVDITKNYCLSAWAAGSTPGFYIRAYCFEEDKVTNTGKVDAHGGLIVEAWNQYSTVIGPEGNFAWPANTGYVQIRCYLSYQSLEPGLVTRISFNEGMYPAPWGGADPGADATAAIIKAELSVNSGGLKIVDTNTAQDDYVRLSPAELQFYYDGTLYSSVKRIEIGDASSGDTVAISPPFKTPPHVMCSLQNLITWDESIDSNYDQGIEVVVYDITESSFKVKANQTLEGGNQFLYTSDHNFPYTESVDTIETVRCRIKVNYYKMVSCPEIHEGASACSTRRYGKIRISIRNHIDHQKGDGYDSYVSMWYQTLTQVDQYIYIEMPYANRWDVKAEADSLSYPPNCHDEGGCSTSSASKWLSYRWDTEGQTVQATGDMNWLAIEGGD
ncbi:MAG: hypothetical protein DRH26_01100 [Deltaproteobacteria bacterium]|nr:MAG: hypothetical protein DRH26_01100 [Deltaproteobacteria bacterium]